MVIKELQEKVPTIYAYGTSIFRKLTQQEQENFSSQLKEKFNIDFKIVSASEESEYTVKGVIENIDYNKKMAVVIGGGGSTEIAIIENKKIIKKINLDFGAMDITNKFPELKEDTVSTNFDEMLSSTMDLVGPIEEQADILVLAGGDYIYFYETVGYALETNRIYQDENQPYLLDMESFDKYDKDILHKSLDQIKKQCPDNIGWWDGARGMRFCMNAVARKLNVKYIIPTRINMLIGLANEIKEENQ